MPPKPQPVALRIELLDIAPLIWRRVLVPNQWTLASLHNYLQWVMGWMDTHAHEFDVGAGVVAPDWWIHEVGMDSDTSNYRDERRVSVAAVAAELGPGGEVEYRYDMATAGGTGSSSSQRLRNGQQASCRSLRAWRVRTPARPMTSAARMATRCFWKSLPTMTTSNTKT